LPCDIIRSFTLLVATVYPFPHRSNRQLPRTYCTLKEQMPLAFQASSARSDLDTQLELGATHYWEEAGGDKRPGFATSPDGLQSGVARSGPQFRPPLRGSDALLAITRFLVSCAPFWSSGCWFAAEQCGAVGTRTVTKSDSAHAASRTPDQPPPRFLERIRNWRDVQGGRMPYAA
jgi:hypothetical protein